MSTPPVRTLVLGHPADLLNPHCDTHHDSPLHAAISRFNYILFEREESFTAEELAQAGIDPDWLTLLAVRLEAVVERRE